MSTVELAHDREPTGAESPAHHSGAPLAAARAFQAGRESPEGTVLIVDDDATSRLIMAAAARQARYRVIQATDGVEAARMFAMHVPDVVLLDVSMPRMDGFEACKEIRGTLAGRHAPIIMVTGMDDIDSITRAYESGATDFVSKPIKAALLRHRVRYVHRSSKTTQVLLQAEVRHRAIVSTMPDAMIRIDGVGRFIEFENDWVAGRLGLPSALAGKSVHDVFGERSADDFICAIERALRTETLQHTEFRLTQHRSQRDYEARIAASGPNEVFAIVRDITERKANEEAMRVLAYQDPLTGTANRQSFMEILAREIARASLTAKTMAVLFLDLDGFKPVNDTYGHATGDRVLRGAAERIKESVRAVDVVARLGGDEFTVLLSEAHNLQSVKSVAARIIEAIAVPFSIDTHQIRLSVSVGIAFYPTNAITPAALVECADAAMYQAKQQGKNRWWLHAPATVS